MTRDGTRAPDEGFSLVEVLVSLGIAGILLGSVSMFLINGMTVTRQEGRSQSGVQLALDGMEQARTLRGNAVLEGRAACTTTCPTPAGRAATYLTGTQRFDIASTPTVTPGLPLPAAGELNVVDGVQMYRYWYVGRCWAPAGGGACIDTASHAPTAANPVPFLRVVVAVTWPGKCTGGTCSYVSTALFAGSPLDPVFRT